MSEGVKLNVDEYENCWATVSFASAPANDEERYAYLHRTLQDWMVANQHYLVQDVQTIHFQGKVYGLNVFYSRKTAGATPQLWIDMDADLQRKFGNEYMEAIMVDAAQFIATTDLPHNTMALINRREIAVVVDRREQRAYIMPLHRFRSRLDPKSAQDLDAWLAGTRFGYFVIPLQGFQP